jgi:hypothetical protein
METYGKVEVYLHHSTSAPDGGKWLVSRPGRFTSVKRVLDAHWIGNWLGSRVSPDALK